MTDVTNHVRNGIGAVRPFIYGGLDLLDFVKKVFGGVELERNIVAGGLHVQTRIGDSVLILSAMEPPFAHATRASIYIYVDNVDTAYERAIAAGASPLGKPADRPFQERTAGVKDGFGNIWYIATYTGTATQ